MSLLKTLDRIFKEDRKSVVNYNLAHKHHRPSPLTTAKQVLSLLAQISIPWSLILAASDPGADSTLGRRYYQSFWPFWQAAAGLLFVFAVHRAKHWSLHLDVRDWQNHHAHTVDRMLILMAVAMSMTAFEMFGVDVQARRFSGFNRFRSLFGCHPAVVHQDGLMIDVRHDTCPVTLDTIAWAHVFSWCGALDLVIQRFNSRSREFSVLSLSMRIIVYNLVFIIVPAFEEAHYIPGLVCGCIAFLIALRAMIWSGQHSSTAEDHHFYTSFLISGVGHVMLVTLPWILPHYFDEKWKMVLPYVFTAFLPVLAMICTEHRTFGTLLSIVVVTLAVVQYGFYLHLHGRSMFDFGRHLKLPRW